MIKICHIVDELNMGGLEKTIVEIALNITGYRHKIWCLKKKGALSLGLEAKGIEVREFGFEGGLNLFSLMKLSRELKREGFGIVHSHGLFPSVWGRLAALAAFVPVKIAHAQNVYYGISRKERIKLLLLSVITDRIIAVSEAVKKCLVEFIGISAGRIVVVYNSAREISKSALRSKKELRIQLGIPEGYFVVGNISRIEPHKGHSFLLKAVAGCRRDGYECWCIIAGEGPALEALKIEAKSLGLEDCVSFLGWRFDVDNLYPVMDVFVLPSILREGLPLTLAEAASAGLPLIATAVGGNPEIVLDGINGFIVPPQDNASLTARIEHLIKDPKEAARMGANSKAIWIDKFNLQEMAQKIEGIYKDEISKHYYS